MASYHRLPSADIAAALREAQATIPTNLNDCTKEKFMSIKHNLWSHLMADRRIPHKSVDSYCTQLLKSVKVKADQVELVPAKECVRCKKLQPHLNFSSNIRAKDGLNQYCRQCEKLRQQAYRVTPKTCTYCSNEPVLGASFCQSCQDKYGEAFRQVRESGGTIKEANKYALEQLR